jgi:membrane associated rhomboid family serine protease
MKNIVIYCVSAICVALYIIHFFCDLTAFGYTQNSPLYTRCTYMFIHLGIIHIACNITAFYYCFKALQQALNQFIIAIAMTAGAYLASFGSEQQMPTIGLSTAVMFIFGALALMFPSKQMMKATIALAAFSILQYAITVLTDININLKAHLYAFLYGAIFALTCKTIKYYKQYINAPKKQPKYKQRKYNNERPTNYSRKQTTPRRK